MIRASADTSIHLTLKRVQATDQHTKDLTQSTKASQILFEARGAFKDLHISQLRKKGRGKWKQGQQ
jgi:hypothetical protein